MNIISYFFPRVKSQEKVSHHINVLAHYDDNTLIDKSAKLIKIFKLSGLFFSTQDEETLDAYKTRRNHLFKHFSSEFALYFWEIRRKVNTLLDGEFSHDYAREANKQYQIELAKREMFHTEHYLAIITKQPEGIIHRRFSFLKQLIYFFDKKSKLNFIQESYNKINEAALNIQNVFADYGCAILSTYQKNKQIFSEPLSFISQLINYDYALLPLKITDSAVVLPRKRLFFNSRSGTIELRSADNTSKFAAVLSIKAYSPITYQGMLNELNNLKVEYTLTQSYRFYDKHNAKSRMRDQQKEMQQSKEESISQAEQLDKVYDEMASGDVGYGKHHFTLTVYANTQAELNQHISLIMASFIDIDITCVREDIGCEAGFWAQLPGNFAYICRPADISSKNLAAFASLHQYHFGKRSGNHWGEAVTVLETISGSPYYFNFHYKDVGNFLIFGAMGSGKTVLIGFLILQSMKFGGKRIIFDKDRGLEILVRAMGGTYEQIKTGLPTRFNPCQLPDTPENRAFLSVIFKKLLTINCEILSEQEISIIESAIDGLYRLDKSLRQLCHIASFFGTKKPGTLRARFDQWHSEGCYAWAFDNEIDSLNLNADVCGFDLGSILADEVCKTPILMYLTYRVEQVIEGERGLLFIDEGWLALSDDYFIKLIENWSRTPRKKNNIFGLATQVANDAAQSNIGKALHESAYCKIFFPNPGADKTVYIDDYGLSPHEYTIVKTLPDDQHYFLLVHGRSANKQSVVVRLNLKDLEDLIAVISAREETLILFDQILLEVGDDPKKWLPLFYQRWKNCV